MSKSSFRKELASKLLENYTRKSEKTVGEAARILLQSSDVRQCIVIKNKQTRAIQTGYEAGIGRVLSTKEGTKYRAAVKRYIKGLAHPFPKDKNAQTRYFMQLIRKNNLTFGKNVFYIAKSFDTIKDNINKFNETYAKNSGGTYSRKAFGKEVNLDHGAEGTASGLVGSVIGAFAVAQDSGGLPKNFKKIFGDNLTAVLDSSLNDLTRGQRGKIHADLMKLVIDAEQIVSKGGDIKAGISMLLTPVLASVNIQKGSKEEKQMQEAFLSAFEATFRGVDYTTLEGSSTLYEKIEKVIVYDALTAKLKSSKNISVKLEAKKVRLSTKTKLTESTKQGKGYLVSGSSRGGKLAKSPGGKAEREDSARSYVSLQNILNSKLSETVRKNMRLPGLENRTGRFASSVKVTDISTTGKGFPSIGYTYRKDPYQVFEMGAGKSPWATPDRDPRKVIDASIREIASQMAIGRFYTRRV